MYGRVRNFKDIAHTPARLAQADLDFEGDVGPAIRAQRLVAIGNAVWTGHSRLTARLRERLEEARDFLQAGGCRPTLRGQERFASAVADARREAAAEAAAA